MRRVFYVAATAFAAFALMTACDKSDPDGTGNGNVENTGDGGNTGGDDVTGGGDEAGDGIIGSIADIPGTYSGKLDVTLGSMPMGSVESQQIGITETQDAENQIDLTVNDFTFMKQNLGDIKITGVPVSEDEEGAYTFTVTEAKDVVLSEEQVLLKSATATLEGTVAADGTLTIDLQINATLAIGGDPQAVTVKFSGTKGSVSE